MKKLKALGAMLVAATLMLGSFSVVLADEQEFADLNVTSRAFYNIRGAHIGYYPVIEGFSDLNDTILRNVEAAYRLASDNTFTASAGPTNVFEVRFTVTDEGQFARIVVTYAFQQTQHRMHPYERSDNYFVDKELGTRITWAEFEAGVAAAAAEEEVEEEDVVEDEVEDHGFTFFADDVIETVDAEEDADDEVGPIMVPLRLHAEALGYTVSWDDETSSVILTRDDLEFTVTVGVNQYYVDGELIALELAPVNQDGSVFVPISFFIQSLGADFTIDANGNIVIAEG